MNMENIVKAVKAAKVVNPIDPLNVYIKFFDLFKIQKMKTITGDNFVVSDGILKCHNYFIPLDSITIVEMARLQLSPFISIFICSIGLLLSLYNIYLYIQYRVKIPYSFSMFIFGFLLSFLVIYLNTKLPYIMTIRLNNNIFCTYMNKNKKFIQDITIIMQECINNRKGEYKFMLNQGEIKYNNNSINITGDIKDSNIDIIGSGGSKISYGDTSIKHEEKKDYTGLTIEDWMNLEKFFILRRQEFSSSDRNYKICNNLATYTQRKDAGKIKEYLKLIGKEGIQMLLNAGTNVVDAVAMETVKPILQKILKLNG